MGFAEGAALAAHDAPHFDARQDAYMRLYVALLLCLLCMLPACGSGLPGSSTLTVTISPPNANVASGMTATFTGNGTGFSQVPLPQWQMVESTSVANEHCGFLIGSTQNANFTNCPMGYVVYDINQFPSTATYYAPPTTGVYHVQFSATQFSTFDHVTKTTTAPVTVTP